LALALPDWQGALEDVDEIGISGYWENFGEAEANGEYKVEKPAARVRWGVFGKKPPHSKKNCSR